MKTILHFRNAGLALIVAMASAIVSKSQPLVFKNSTHEAGTPSSGSDGSVYRFPSVTNNVDALVKINGRSTPLVTLSSIDVTSSGYDNAFQPQVAYNGGNVTGAKSWWMEFTITFVTKNTNSPVSLNSIYATEVDLDGNGDKLHEWASFFYPSAYTLETPTSLITSNLVQNILGIVTNVGTNFDGTVVDHSGIDTFATNLMVTARYNTATTITYRAGGATTGTTTGADRQYSVYFKNFTYTVPLVTLPIKLESFNATLNGSKADLKWVTAQETNVSHFVVERSFDGKNFTDAGTVFAYGNTSEKKEYSFSDNLSSVQQGIIYYRLRSVDNDGKSQLSEVRIVRIGKQNEMLVLQTYPNPVTNELRVTIPSAWQNKEVIMEIFGANGQKLKAFKQGNSNQTETITVNDLTSGCYFLRASCDREIAQQKFIKN